MPLRFLLTAPPRAGKTTVVRHVVEQLRAAGVPVAGFVTAEIREGGARVGFTVTEIGGPSTVLAHVDWVDRPQVGRYGVDVVAFERVARPALMRAIAGRCVTVVDELAAMELLSPGFVAAVDDLLEAPVPVLATVQVAAHPVTDAWKRRADVEVVLVTEANRETLAGWLAARLATEYGLR
jgi:nucleoside-triphosphatase